MNIYGHNWGNRLVQTRTEPAGAGFCWNRYIRNGPKTEQLLTLLITTTGKIVNLMTQSSTNYGLKEKYDTKQ